MFPAYDHRRVPEDWTDQPQEPPSFGQRLQHSLNATKRAEQRVTSLQNSIKERKRQWATYQEEMKAAWIKEKNRCQRELERLDGELTKAFMLQEGARKDLLSVANQEEQQQQEPAEDETAWQETLGSWQTSDSDSAAVLQRAMTATGGATTARPAMAIDPASAEALRGYAAGILPPGMGPPPGFGMFMEQLARQGLGQRVGPSGHGEAPINAAHLPSHATEHADPGAARFGAGTPTVSDRDTSSTIRMFSQPSGSRRCSCWTLACAKAKAAIQWTASSGQDQDPASGPTQQWTIHGRETGGQEGSCNSGHAPLPPRYRPDDRRPRHNCAPAGQCYCDGGAKPDWAGTWWTCRRISACSHSGRRQRLRRGRCVHAGDRTWQRGVKPQGDLTEPAFRNMPFRQLRLSCGRYRFGRPPQCELCLGYTVPLEKYHPEQGFLTMTTASAVMWHIRFHVGCQSIGMRLFLHTSVALFGLETFPGAWFLLSSTHSFIGFEAACLRESGISVDTAVQCGAILHPKCTTNVSQSAFIFGCSSPCQGIGWNFVAVRQAPVIKAARLQERPQTASFAFDCLLGLGAYAANWAYLLCGAMFMALWRALWVHIPGRRSPLGQCLSCGSIGVPIAFLKPLGCCGSPATPILHWHVRRYAMRKRQGPMRCSLGPLARLCRGALVCLGLAHLPCTVWAAPDGVRELAQVLNAIQSSSSHYGFIESPEDYDVSSPADLQEPLAWPVPFRIEPRPNVLLNNQLVVELKPGTQVESDNATEWLGVVVFAPHYQPRALAVHMMHIHDSVDLIDVLCEHCADLFDPGLDCLVPLTPQRFGDGYATVLKFASAAGDSTPQPQAAIVFDLTRVGGPYFAAMHPIHTTTEGLIQVAMPLTSYGRDPFEVYIGDSDQPCAVIQDLLLHNGDVVTIVSAGLVGPRPTTIEALFRLPHAWGAVNHTPQEFHTPSVSVVTAERRLLLSFFHHSRQTVEEAIRERLRVPAGSLTCCCAVGFENYAEEGTHCDRVVAAVHLPAQQAQPCVLPRRRDAFTFCDLRPLGRLPECHHSHSYVVHLPTLLHLFGVSVPFGQRVCVDGVPIAGSDAFVGANATLIFRLVATMPSPDLTPRSGQDDGSEDLTTQDGAGTGERPIGDGPTEPGSSSASTEPHASHTAGVVDTRIGWDGPSDHCPALAASRVGSGSGRSLLAACFMQQLCRTTAAAGESEIQLQPAAAHTPFATSSGAAGERVPVRPTVLPPLDPVSFVTMTAEEGDAGQESLLGVVLFAPHYQTEYMSIYVHQTEGPWSVFERVRHLSTAIPTNLLTCLAFVDPLPFDGVAAFVAYSEAVHASGYVAVILDLAGCGGNLFATTLPRSFSCAQFFAFVRPLIGAAQDPVVLFVGRSTTPHDTQEDLSLEHGQRLTVVYSPAIPVQQQTYEKLFDPPRHWLDPDAIPRPVISSGVCLLHRDQRFYIGRRAFPGQSPQAAAAHCIHTTEDQVTIGVAKRPQIADLCLHGERCKCVAAVVDIPPPLPVPPARRARTDFFLFLDLRPLGIPFFVSSTGILGASRIS